MAAPLTDRELLIARFVFNSTIRHLYKTPEYKAARAACRERAGDRCEECRKLNGQLEWRLRAGEGSEVYEVLIQCGAAHLDNNPSNNAPKNLKWLCRGCHLRTDAMHHKRTRCARKDASRPILQELEAIAERSSQACAAEGRPETPQLRSLKAYLQNEVEGRGAVQLAAGGTCAPREQLVKRREFLKRAVDSPLDVWKRKEQNDAG